MPEFSNPFIVKKSDRKLTKEEIIRAVRYMIAAEYEATELYIQTAESTDDELVKMVFNDIAIEELEHAGEFLRLLHELAPEEKKHYEHGAREVEEMIAKLKKTKKVKKAKK